MTRFNMEVSLKDLIILLSVIPVIPSISEQSRRVNSEIAAVHGVQQHSKSGYRIHFLLKMEQNLKLIQPFNAGPAAGALPSAVISTLWLRESDISRHASLYQDLLSIGISRPALLIESTIGTTPS